MAHQYTKPEEVIQTAKENRGRALVNVENESVDMIAE